MKRKMFLENTTITESDNFLECVFRNVIFKSGDLAFGACKFDNCTFESGEFIFELCNLNTCAVPHDIFRHAIGHTTFTEITYIT